MTQHNHLEDWLAQERDILATLDAGPGPGVARREQIAHLNGLQQMQAMPAVSYTHLTLPTICSV